MEPEEEAEESKGQKNAVKNKPFNMQKPEAKAVENKPRAENTGRNEFKKLSLSSALVRKNRGK
jgi:hypothetical protein